MGPVAATDGQVRLEGLATQVRWLGTLARVIPWGMAQRPPWIVADVVIQDEYTHDILLATEGDARVLVLDCT